MYSPYSFNYNITSIVYYRHIDNSLYQKEWDVNVPLLFKQGKRIKNPSKG